MPFGNGVVLISPEQQLMLHMHNKIPWKYGIYGLHLSVLDVFLLTSSATPARIARY
jgi:hypothetical protein